MEKRYLINNEVYKSTTPYPNKDNFRPYLYATYEDYLKGWQQSLIKLDCDESELDKIRDSVVNSKFYGQYSIKTSYMFNNDTIDITSITTVKAETMLLSNPPKPLYKVYFKKQLPKSSNRVEEILSNINEVESENQDSLLDELSDLLYLNYNGLCSKKSILDKFTIIRK
jgi:hypothetical protein